jgi:hypothetical protein
LFTKPRKSKFGLILVLITVNTLLVFEFGQNQYSLRGFFDESINEVASELSNVAAPVDEEQTEQAIEVPVMHLQDTNFETKRTTHRELPQVGGACTILSSEQEEKDIYKWQKNGITHLSDTPRSVSSDSPVSIIGTIKPEMISINFINSYASFALKEKIKSRVMQAREMFERVVPQSAVKPVSINFRLFNDVTRYERYRAKVAPSIGASIGFYMGSINESVVMMKSETQGTNTAVHEAMHSINRHWFGNMSQWLNEGLAEYAETNQSLPLQSNTWFKTVKQKRLIPLKQLLRVTKNEWHAKEKEMYATSWAFVAFMMQQQRNMLSRLLLEESYNGCRSLTLSDVERVSGKSLVLLQREFDNWLDSKI